VYADAAEDAAERDLLVRLVGGSVDAIAFTSTPQVERLFSVGGASEVQAALSRTLVAAVGPVVAAALKARGVTVALMPEDSFFLKPLTSALEEALRPPQAAEQRSPT
jgi:uroporphyrinogen-III synthase